MFDDSDNSGDNSLDDELPVKVTPKELKRA